MNKRNWLVFPRWVDEFEKMYRQSHESKVGGSEEFWFACIAEAKRTGRKYPDGLLSAALLRVAKRDDAVEKQRYADLLERKNELTLILGALKRRVGANP